MLSRRLAGPGYTVYDEDDPPAALPQAEAPPGAEAPPVAARSRTLGRVAAGGLLAAAVASVAGLALADALRGQHRRPAAAVARANDAPYGVRDTSRSAEAHRGFARRLHQPHRGIRGVALHTASRVPLPDVPAARARAGSILAAPSPPAQPRQSEFGFER